MLTDQDIAALRSAAELNPRALDRMSEEEQLAAAMAIVELQDARYAKEPYSWLMEQVQTLDEAENRVAPVPDKEYIHDFFDALHAEQLLAVPKSRRMLITWLVSAYLCHQARYRKYFSGFVQSDTEMKAAFVIDQRIKFIEDNLPPIFRREYKSNKTVAGTVGQMVWTKTGSMVKGIAQGKDGFRTYTPSFVFMDEVDFQQQGHQSFVAAIPFAEKKCKIVLVSSSAGPHGPLANMARSCGFKRFQ